MQKRDIIVVGASAGGLPPLVKLVAGLPADLNASIFILRHYPADQPSDLATILSRNSNVRSEEVINPEPIKKGRIYVAPSDMQMVLKLNSIVLEAPLSINYFRPTIDALFISAANFFGCRVIGIILSGLLDDGAQGLAAIRTAGGISIVQEPGDASFKAMPENALRHGGADFVIPASEICSLLTTLV